MTTHPGLVAVVVYDDLCLFEFGVAAELFGLPRPELDVSWYDFAVVGLESRCFRSLGGVSIQAAKGLSVLNRARTIVLPGWKSPHEEPPARLLRALIAAHGQGARLMSICSGAFVLGYAGLLDGKRATTHWRYTEEFRSLFPRVELVPDVLYVDEGQIITSAGSAAGIDAGLHLIRRDFGAAIANRVARRLVVTPHREGGQKQFIPSPVDERSSSSRFQDVMQWARQHLAEPITVRRLAYQAAMSERNFLRRFREATGATPKAWLLNERISKAQELIETTDEPVDRIGERCGFVAPETFRLAFRNRVGLAPSKYRHRFKRDGL
ncbi:MAG TPA: transcriptional regulator FtrA [Methyloceanibacter sp.]|nr:transcriptional regulator FtrA [Methyloceanibacter sp.]